MFGRSTLRRSCGFCFESLATCSASSLGPCPLPQGPEPLNQSREAAPLEGEDRSGFEGCCCNHASSGTCPMVPERSCPLDAPEVRMAEQRAKDPAPEPDVFRAGGDRVVDAFASIEGRLAGEGFRGLPELRVPVRSIRRPMLRAGLDHARKVAGVELDEGSSRVRVRSSPIEARKGD